LTFIICKSPPASKDFVAVGQDDKPDAMIGDVNLFLNDYMDDVPMEHKRRLIGEINIMIARRDVRRMGFGTTALKAFLSYVWTNRALVVKELETNKQVCELIGYQAKIDAENQASIHLFESLGFKRKSEEPNYFGEVELELIWTELDSLWEPPKELPYLEHHNNSEIH
jgi:RimJ/RimL family protein N-acetyltransferase